jgi:hypothetical protein
MIMIEEPQETLSTKGQARHLAEGCGSAAA